MKTLNTDEQSIHVGGLRYFLSEGELAKAIQIYKKHFADELEQAMQTADMAVTGCYKVPFSMAAREFVPIGVPPSWSVNPTEDLEFEWILNRHLHVMSLGIAYLLTGEESYAEVFQRDVITWIEQNPMPEGEAYEAAAYFQKRGPWRLLEVSMRAHSWLWGATLLQRSRVLQEGSFQGKLEASLRQHARYLTAYFGTPDMNHASIHMQGLFFLGICLPAAPEAPMWRQLAAERLELCLLRQVLPDGVHNEMATSYHISSMNLFLLPALMGARLGYVLPSLFGDRLERMARYVAAITRPDGTCTPWSDSDWSKSGRYMIGLAGALLEDSSLLALGELSADALWQLGPEAYEAAFNAIQESRHTPSNGVSTVFPDAGYYIMRSSRHYLAFDAGPLGDAHGHADCLSFEWALDGQLVFVDPGRYTYQEGEWRRYFKSTYAHNTVTIDGLDQTPYASTQQWAEPEAVPTVYRHLSTEQYELVDAAHNGYERLASPVRHRRWLYVDRQLPLIILADWLQGTGTHEAEQRFQLQEGWLAVPAAEPDEGVQPLHLAGGGRQLTMRWYTDGTFSQARSRVGEAFIAQQYGTKAPTLAVSVKGVIQDNACLLSIIYDEKEVSITNALIEESGKRLQITIRSADGASSTLNLDEHSVVRNDH
ncbi:alginate lyase family protein [Paenibacillus sp. F411]|uniref:heparinase II/III family protein n=1 Tax=Paenibacillus sp. F411 TaxID=2820239 RepID=UPI001AAF1423|nr:alginate lyase family protein [Paenibacillus sp. F411]MBO2945441.1 alginate lyase family protein [Paenibacillus sp. F411]